MKAERKIYIDVLNIVAIISVIALHQNGIVHTFSTSRSWATSLIVETICYFAVPIFIMISGANLMNYKEKYDTKTFFKKRFTRVLIPAIVWIAIMFIWKIFIIKAINLNGITLIDFINMIFSNKEEGTYYYLFVILGVYLTMPLFSNLADKKYRPILWYTAISFFIFNAFIPNVLLLFNINYNSDFSLQIGYYMIYPILGYLLSTEELSKKKRILLYSFGLLAIVYRYCLTYFPSVEAGELVKTVWGYSQFHTIILASAVFVFFKNINYKKIEKNEKITKLLSTVSSCSFGIYLLHKIVMYYEIAIFNINIHSWQWRTIGIFTTYFISLIIVYIIKKIPIVKKIVG